MNIAIYQYDHEWHFAEHQEEGRPKPHRLSAGYASKADATTIAIETFGPDNLTLTGVADKTICRTFGVRFVDPRGNRGREGKGKGHVDQESFRLWNDVKAGRIEGPGEFTRRIRAIVREVRESRE